MSGYEDLPKAVAHSTGDIKHHLWSLYWMARMMTRSGSGLIVELGVRGGDSTRALIAAAKDTRSKVVSYDKHGDAYNVRKITEGIDIPWEDGIWECRQADSVEAGIAWNEERAIVDLLFIDTLHTLDHTLKELEVWGPRVRSGGAILLHDTGNEDPSQNGVRPAIEYYLKTCSGWVFENHPHVAEGDVGLGILWRRG